MIKGPKTLLSEAITAALDEFFEVDPDTIYVDLMGDTQIVLTNTKLRPRAAELLKSDHQIVQSLTTGVVNQALFTWKWASLGSEFWVRDANLSISGLEFKSQLSYQIEEGFERTQSGRVVSSKKPERRRSSLAEIKQAGLVESYIRNQVEHIIDALTIAVQDFEFRIELPPNDLGEVKGITASGNSVELKSVGGGLGGEERLRHRASFVNGGLAQQLSFGNIRLGTFKTSLTGIDEEPFVTVNFPLLEALSYQLMATRYTGERFSGLTSGLKVVGTPVLSSHRDIEEMDVLFHAGLDQIKTLVDLGNIILQKKSSVEEETNKREIVGSTEEGNLNRDDGKLETLLEESEQEEVGQECVGVLDGAVWYPSLTDEEWKAVEKDFAEDEAEFEKGRIVWSQEETNENVYISLKNDVKSSIFQFPIAGVSVMLPNEAKLTLEALCVNYKADGTVLNIESEYGSGILIDNYQLVNTNSGNDGSAKSRWVFDVITSRFIVEQDHDSDCLPNSNVAQVRWTEDKFSRLIQGWMALMDAIKGLNLEKNPGK